LLYASFSIICNQLYSTQYISERLLRIAMLFLDGSVGATRQEEKEVPETILYHVHIHIHELDTISCVKMIVITLQLSDVFHSEVNWNNMKMEKEIG
jgi:hypothetical protein